jgi:hypothetical protein
MSDTATDQWEVSFISGRRLCAVVVLCAALGCLFAGSASAAHRTGRHAHRVRRDAHRPRAHPLWPSLYTLRPRLGPTPQASPYGTISGINAFSLSELPPSQWNQQLAAMSAHGVQFVRSDADWGTIEPQPPDSSGPSWQFSSTDVWVAALASHHLAWQPILDYNNSWAQAVTNTSAFATFAKAVAARYGSGGSFWTQHPQLPYMPAQIFEVWNEENGQPWFIPPEQYGPLYAAVRAAIHTVDPHASVDVGGLSDDSGDFNPSDDYPAWYVIGMLSTDPGLEGNIDGFALHPYGTTATDAAEWVVEFRYVLDLFHESSAPIDITEFGWVTGDSSQEEWRAAQMNALGLAFSRSDCGIREVAPYDWINPTVLHEPGDFGFVDGSASDTTLRPAGTAWFQAFTAGASMAPFNMCGPGVYQWLLSQLHQG